MSHCVAKGRGEIARWLQPVELCLLSPQSQRADHESGQTQGERESEREEGWRHKIPQMFLLRPCQKRVKKIFFCDSDGGCGLMNVEATNQKITAIV